MAALAELRSLIQPTTLAVERTLPVLPSLAALLPGGGLALGSTVRVEGATSVALALVAGASSGGTWVAAVGAATLGWAAAADLGVDLSRVLVVPRVPAADWSEVVAALVDSVGVVLLHLSGPVRERDARRLTARARERGAVLIVAAPRAAWPLAAEVVVSASGTWSGLADGHGCLSARRMTVSVSGRRAAGAGRRAQLWLPAADGTVRTVLGPSGAMAGSAPTEHERPVALHAVPAG